jgi:hypothetical protein
MTRSQHDETATILDLYGVPAVDELMHLNSLDSPCINGRWTGRFAPEPALDLANEYGSSDLCDGWEGETDGLCGLHIVTAGEVEDTVYPDDPTGVADRRQVRNRRHQ